MVLTRREFLVRAAGLCGCALTGWAAPPADALRAAAGFFAARQSRDGAWRSDSYAAFRVGDALTPVVLWALHPTETDVTARGLHWLEELTDSPARRSAVIYPLFTAGYATQVFASSGDTRRAAVWADAIESLRIRAELGWPADAAACGAWGDSATPPRLPPDVNPPPDMLAPNISATVLALQALRAAGRPAKSALPFIESCQNYSASEPGGFNDGGFFFTPGDPVRNKAGIAGRDSAVRYRSYGSATCDGVLALRASGLKEDHPRLRAALGWLRANSDGIRHSGTWPHDRYAARESLRFYHAQGLAAVALDSQCRALAAGLRALQGSDGSWTGLAPDSCEDEPLLATAFAVRALSCCGQLL
jgi:hypothetical protein